MTRLIDETGNVHGRLTVIRRAIEDEMSGAQRRATEASWVCRCECGEETVVLGTALRSGSSSSCGCLQRELISKRQTVNEVGNTYGRLTVLKRAENPPRSGAVYWLCQCECGEKTIVRGHSLRCGRTRSCGCIQQDMPRPWLSLPEGVAAMHALQYNYRHNAARRGLEWALTESQFTSLTQRNCHYCGRPPARVYETSDSNGGYVYNGLDRIDNDKEYTPNNVVPCCHDCNQAKSDRSLSDFTAWAVQLYKHLIETGLV